jgi:heme/copper-type cytochrome/quinol oxidase subunit 2
MMQQISMYFLVLSVIFLLRYVFAFLIRFKDEDPKPMEVNKISEVLLYLASAYVITYLIVI